MPQCQRGFIEKRDDKLFARGDRLFHEDTAKAVIGLRIVRPIGGVAKGDAAVDFEPCIECAATENAVGLGWIMPVEGEFHHIAACVVQSKRVGFERASWVDFRRSFKLIIASSRLASATSVSHWASVGNV